MRRCVVSVMGVLIACCGPSASTPEPRSSQVHVEPVPAPEPTGDDLAEDEAPEEPGPPPSYSDAELDEMDRAGLESACFAGSTAACDRLGH